MKSNLHYTLHSNWFLAIPRDHARIADHRSQENPSSQASSNAFVYDKPEHGPIRTGEDFFIERRAKNDTEGFS